MQHLVCAIFIFQTRSKTIAVIAEETGLKESTVKSKLLRGREKLKLKMEKKGFRYEDCKIFFE